MHTSVPFVALSLIGSAMAQDPDVMSGKKLSTAGQCVLSLAFISFLVNAMIWFVREKKARAPPQADAVPGMALFDQIFTDERLNTAKGGLTFVPVLSVMMLFILFRTVDQKVQPSPTIQWFFVLASFGIYMQCLDVMDIRVSSDVFGNLSQKGGMLFTYLGFFGITVGMFTVRDPAIPLSVAAQVITALTTLLFILYGMIKFLEYKKEMMGMAGGIPGAGMVPGMKSEADPLVNDEQPADAENPTGVNPNAMANVFDSSKLAAAVTVCNYVPMISILCFYLHFRMRFLDQPMPAPAQAVMYLACVGIYVQALGVVVLADLNPMLGTGCRVLGLLATYAGYGGIVFFAITAAPIQSIAVWCTMTLITIGAVIQIALFAMEEYMKDAVPLEKKKMLEDILGTLTYAMTLSVLMLYIHFRARMILQIDRPPAWSELMMEIATGSILLQMVFIVLEGTVLGKTVEDPETGAKKLESPAWVTAVRVVAVFALYIGFTGIVVTAFVMVKEE